MPTILQMGCRGPDVARLQRLLNQRLIPSPGLVEDGIFGHATHDAVLRFQEQQRLTPDGVVGAKTWGELQRSRPPVPVPLSGKPGHEPSVLDHVAPPRGPAANAYLAEEAWFEQRYPNWVKMAKAMFTTQIDSWVHEHWGSSPCNGPIHRVRVYARGKYRNDNQFEKEGDKPQDAFEADKVLGSFSFDVVMPVVISYSKAPTGGPKAAGCGDRFSWETEMYVEDVLGAQEGDLIYGALATLSDDLPKRLLPSRRVKRAKWQLRRSGRTYVVQPGDTLAKIAELTYGNAGQWEKILAANPTRIKDPKSIRPGQRLAILGE